MRTRLTKAGLEKKRLAWGAVRWLHKVKGLTLTDIDDLMEFPRSTASRLHSKGSAGEDLADAFIDMAYGYGGTEEGIRDIYEAAKKKKGVVPFPLLRDGKKDEVAPPTKKGSGDLLIFLQDTADSMEELEDGLRIRADIASPLVAAGLDRMADEIMGIRQKYLADYVR